MSLIQSANLATDPAFILKVKVAMITAAQQIATEAVTLFNLYLKRHVRAVQILNSPDSHLGSFVWGVVANPAITSSATDADIQFTVNSIYDALAGVGPGDATTPYITPYNYVTPPNPVLP